MSQPSSLPRTCCVLGPVVTLAGLAGYGYLEYQAYDAERRLWKAVDERTPPAAGPRPRGVAANQARYESAEGRPAAEAQLRAEMYTPLALTAAGIGAVLLVAGGIGWAAMARWEEAVPTPGAQVRGNESGPPPTWP